MSKLKYKVGDKAGPFEIVGVDNSPMPYYIQSKCRKTWLKKEDVESLFDHYAKSETLEKKAESQRKMIAYWKGTAKELDSELDQLVKVNAECSEKNAQLNLDLETTNKNFLILKNENKALKESNVELRGANDEMKAEFEKDFASFERIRNSNQKEILDLHEELKTVKGHLDLRVKGIEALEADAKKNRTKIASLKSDFETKRTELEILEEDYNCLKDVQKYTKVVGWVGWILFFIALFGLMFFKG